MSDLLNNKHKNKQKSSSSAQPSKNDKSSNDSKEQSKESFVNTLEDLGISFKPITSGLGFEQKQVELFEEVEEFQEESMPNVDQLLEEDLVLSHSDDEHKDGFTGGDRPSVGIITPEIIQPKVNPTSPLVETSHYREPTRKRQNQGDSLKIKEKVSKELQFKFSGHDGLVKTSYKKVGGSIFAMTVDQGFIALIVMSFLMGLFFVSDFDVFEVMQRFFSSELLIYFGLGFYFASSFIYYFLTRIFFGRSFGEWSTHIRLGQPKDFKTILYPVRLMVRILVIAATGVVVLPLLSCLFRTDIPSLFCGLRLHREQKTFED